MPRIPGTSHRQTTFLRAFRTHPTGPPLELWPSPALLRKWMRRPTFARAMESILATLRFQTDFHLAAAAALAARSLAKPANPDSPPDDSTTRYIAQLLRLAHLRQRFPTLPAAAQAEPEEKELTEREKVYLSGGEDAVEAFDELVRLRNEDGRELPTMDH